MSRSTPIHPQSRRERREAARLDRAPKVRGRARTNTRPAWRSPVALVSAAALIVGAGLVALALPKATAGEELRMPPTSYAAQLADGDRLGAETAPVVIQLYSDFQCPACKLFVTTELARLTDEFVLPGIARIEAHDIAFLGRGTPDESLELAVGAACAAEQDRYWQFHDLIFWNQGRENLGDHDAAFIGRVADQALHDRAAWDACMAGDEHRQAIRSATSAALGSGITVTPTLLVNGQKLEGVPDYDALAALIQGLAAPASPGASGDPSGTAVPS